MRIASVAVVGILSIHCGPLDAYQPELRRAESPLASCAPATEGLIWDAADRSGMGDLALDAAHLSVSRWGEAALSGARVPAYDFVRRQPSAVGCAIEALREGARPDPSGPVEAAIRSAARALGAPLAEAEPAPPVSYREAFERLCRIAGGCFRESGQISPALAADLAPVLWALGDALLARDAMFAETSRTEAWWYAHGGNVFLPTTDRMRPNPAWGPDRAVLEAPRGPLFAAAEALARAVEALPWSAHISAGAYAVSTPRGDIRIAGAGRDVHPPDARDLLLVDLGGDDVYLGSVGANPDGVVGVALAVDVSGDDRYGYPEAGRVDAAGDLPADAGGRGSLPGRTRDASLSEIPRQGGGRAGVGMLFDLAGDDRYATLRGGQGAAQLGVGVLFDGAGDDVYLAESFSQGAGLMGIGLLVDLVGQDRREALHAAQGFGATFGFGGLLDGRGDDTDRCASTPARYPAPQSPGVNASFCQGAAQGARDEDPALALPGGLGLFFDGAGDDVREAAVFAQGVGYWTGLGVLLDDAGADTYRHRWYAAGAGVHFGAGLLSDAGGDDVYGDGWAETMSQGAGHHFGLGVFSEAGGADTYDMPAFSGGAASCGASAVFADSGGDDLYRSTSPGILGAAKGAKKNRALPGRAPARPSATMPRFSRRSSSERTPQKSPQTRSARARPPRVGASSPTRTHARGP